MFCLGVGKGGIPFIPKDEKKMDIYFLYTYSDLRA